MAVFGFAVVVGVLLTPERNAFAHKWIWLAGVIAFVIFLPYLLGTFRTTFRSLN